MNIHINGEIERLIQSALASGKFASAEEFLVAMVEVWKDRTYELDRATTVNSEELAFEVFDRLGVIGCMHSGASDLATNPQHMEGFGR